MGSKENKTAGRVDILYKDSERTKNTIGNLSSLFLALVCSGRVEK